MTCEGNQCGTGGGNFPQPGDPDNTSTVLSATPAFGGIDIRWNYPTTNPFAVAHVLLYRAIIGTFDAAIFRELLVGQFFYDKVDPGIEYFYWIRIVSVNGTVGDPIGPASAAARPSIEGMIELLTGHIDAGVLAQSLKTEIQRIPAIDLSIIQEVGDRIASNVALGQALDAVRSDVGAALTLVANEVTQRTEGDTALVSSVNTIAAGVAGNAAAIVEERNIRVTADTAMGQHVDTLYAEITATTDLKITSAIQTERTVRVTREDALATQIDALHVQVGTDIQGAIQNEITLRVNADSALGVRIDTMAVTVGQNSAAIQNETTARADAISAETNTRSTQFASVQPAINAAVAGEANARAAAITAAVQTETNARVNADNSLSNQITTAQSTLDGQITSVQTTLQANINTTNGKVTQIGALYNAKVTVNGLIGGFGVFNDGTSVEAGFDVDTFWVGRTSANKRKPFIIVGQETFIDEAVINKLTFSKLRSDDGSVIIENGKIKVAYLDADNIVAKNINVVSGSYGSTAYTSMTNGLTQMYYPNGSLLLRMGVW